jgi:hypothetical protein
MDGAASDEWYISMNWPRLRSWQFFTILATMAMELSWLTPWYTLLTSTRAQSSSIQIYAVFGSIFLASYLLAAALHALRLTSQVQYVVLFIILIVGVWLGLTALVFSRVSLAGELSLEQHPISGIDVSTLIRPELVAIAGVIFVWRRGSSLAQEWIGPRAVMRAFRLGVVIFVVHSLVISLQSVDFPDLELFMFLFSGLLALGGARLSSLGGLRGGKPLPMNRRWLFGVIVFSGTLIGLTVSIGILTRVKLSESIGEALHALFDNSARLFMLLARPVVLFIIKIFEWLLMKLWPLLDDFGQNTEGIEELAGDVRGLTEGLGQQVEPPAWAADLGDWISTILLWGGAILVLVLLFNGLVRRSRSRSWDLDEERDTVLSLKDLPQHLLWNLRQRAAQALAAFSRLRPGERLLAAARIRRLYAELLDLSAKLGSPRPSAATPNEFVTVLHGLFPPLYNELNTITKAYLRVRYGELPESRQEVEVVEAAWERIHGRGEEMLSNLRHAVPEREAQV